MNKIFFILAVLLIGIGLFLRNFESFGPDIIIENPFVSIYPLEETPFKASWASGYEFKPSEKKLLDGGSSLLLYKGIINNPCLSFSSVNLDFDSLTKKNNAWHGKTLSGEPVYYKTPEVTLEHVNETGFDSYYTRTFQSSPGTKNLQPDGRVILSAKITLDEEQYGIILPSSLNFKSIRVRDGRFVAKRSM